MLNLILATCMALAPLPPADDPPTLDLCHFLDALHDLDRLPLLAEGISSHQASSYDRASRFNGKKNQYENWDANNDRGHYIRVNEETGESVLADLKGPGCIQRIWSANPQGKIRFYLDGAETPLEFSFAELFTGSIPPFAPPLVWQRVGENRASCCYLPIPFQESCRVTADQPHDQYYHIGYTTFPRTTRLKTFALPLSQAEEAALVRAQARLNDLGNDPDTRKYPQLPGSQTIAPGGEAQLVELEGPAVIQRFRLRIISEEPDILRKTLLKVYWDQDKKPAILAPAGDFFGQSFSKADFRSLPMGFLDGQGYCYFPMPFAGRARIYLLNHGQQPITAEHLIDYEKRDALPDKTAYLHAGWRREKYCASFEYPLLSCRGRGKLVGTALFVDNAHGGWWGEGDEKIHVDGETFPSYFGTGTEDYFGDAWGLEPFTNAFHGCSFTRETRQSCYRWHISDNIPFNTQLRFTLENYSADQNVKNDYASMAYWYQWQVVGSQDDFSEPTLLERLPRIPSQVKGALEAENIYPEGKLPQGARIVFDNGLSAGAGLEILGEPGALFYLPLSVPRRDVYRVKVITAETANAPTYAVTLKNKALGERTVLDKGKTILNLGIRGKRRANGPEPLILDYVELTAYKKFIPRWIVTGPFDNPRDVGLHVPYPPERQETVTGQERYKGRNDAEVTWQPAECDAEGRLNLVPLMVPSTWGVAYAYATVSSPKAMQTDLYVGSDDGIKIWINKEVVHDHREDRNLVPDTDWVVVKLARGVNRILVKVDQGEGGWGFAIRLRDDQDQLVYGLEEILIR